MAWSLSYLWLEKPRTVLKQFGRNSLLFHREQFFFELIEFQKFWKIQHTKEIKKIEIVEGRWLYLLIQMELFDIN